MKPYLLDTNHLSAMLQRKEAILKRIGEGSVRADLGISMPSIAELWYMVFNSARVRENSHDLSTLLKGLKRFQFTEDAAVEFGRVKTELRKKGRPIPDPDSQIAAIARVNNLVVLTADAHFNNVPDLKTENWLAE